MCRQGSGNLPSSTNLPYQSKTHFNTPTCSKYNSKKQMKKHTPLPPYPPLPPLTPLIRDECRVTKKKSERNENDYAF